MNINNIQNKLRQLNKLEEVSLIISPTLMFKDGVLCTSSSSTNEIKVNASLTYVKERSYREECKSSKKKIKGELFTTEEVKENYRIIKDNITFIITKVVKYNNYIYIYAEE